MPAFKVWDCHRINKRVVIAANLKDVLSNGATKLGLSCSPLECRLVLEEDGTLIDEDEILIELQPKTFQLLTPDEQWVPLPALPVVPVPSQSLSDDTPCPVAPATPSSTAQVSDAPDKVASGGTPNTSFANDLAITQEITRAPLPNFSPLILQHIQGKSVVPERIWSMMISEAAHYYLGNWPGINERSQYSVIGSRMYEKYPAIGLQGANPWSAFNKSLSQKIRHLKLGLKTKSQSLSSGSGEPPAKKQCFKVTTSTSSSTTTPVGTTAEDIDRHVAELKKEWEKSDATRNCGHLKTLLQATRSDRVAMLEEASVMQMQRIYEKYPCFQESTFVLYEFTLQFSKDKLKQVSDNLKQFMFTVEKMENIKVENPDDPLRMLAVIRAVEKTTRWHQGGKGGGKNSCGSIIQVKSDVDDGNISKYLSSNELESPHVLAFIDDNRLQGIFIVGDTKHTEVRLGSGILGAALTLLCLYYTLDLDYPRAYAMLLAAFQQFVMDEPYKHETSTGFKTFVKNFSKQLAKRKLKEAKEATKE